MQEWPLRQVEEGIDYQMGKFVKVAVAPVVLGLGRVLLQGLATYGAPYLMNNLKKFNWMKLAPALLNSSSALKDKFLQLFPQWGVGIVEGAKNLVEDFTSALKEESFQNLLVVALMEKLQLNALAEDMYSPEAFATYFTAEDAYGQPLLAGGYQKTMGKIGKVPPMELLESQKTPDSFLDEVERIYERNSNNPEKAKIELAQFIKRETEKIESMEAYTGREG